MSLVDYTHVTRAPAPAPDVEPVGPGFVAMVDTLNVLTDANALRTALARHKVLIWREPILVEKARRALAALDPEYGALHVPAFPELLFVEAANTLFVDRATGASFHLPWKADTLAIWRKDAVSLERADEAPLRFAFGRRH
ncbi:MAG: hypothetical protein ABUS57_10990 [Pseudomonadota bacterium]